MNIADINLPSKFTEETINYSGDKTTSNRIVSDMTKKRIRAEKSILRTAQLNNVPVDEVIKRILINSTPVLSNYVRSKGETPNSNPLLLAVQATLLRADEVGTIAKALDTTDDDATIQIESAEQDAIDNSNADAKNIFSPDVQAAIKLSLDHIKKAHTRIKNGSGKLQDFIAQVKKANKSDGFEIDTNNLLYSPTGGKIGSPSPNGGKSPYNATGDTTYTVPTDYDTPPDYSSSGSSFFDFFDKIVSGIGSISSSIKTAAGSIQTAVSGTKSSVQDLLTGVSNQASDIGAQSIQKAIQGYLPYIIGTIVLIVLIIVIAIYASKHK